MDVNAQNFAQELPAIEAAIANSDFMSFDTEMTGLFRGSDRPIPFESPSSRYQRVRGSSEGFLIIQFGLACFRFDAPTSSYEVTTFNFYIFPQQIFSVDRRFHCQTGSLRFLASHNFDFNQTFYKGIPFLDRIEEAKVRQETEQQSARIATPQQRSDLSLKDEDKAWLTERVATLTAWKATAASGAIMKFERCSPYHRRILYQEMPKHFPDVKLETIRAEECIAASFPTAEQMQVRERERRDKLEAEFLASLGFTRVIRAMQGTRKPVVGHNMLLDSIHMWEQFESPLPASLDDFKAGFRAVWPAVYDTKHVASMSPVLNKLVTATSLEDAAARTLREPFTPVTLRSVHDKYGGDVTKAHEAGYDAFLTGSLFLRMCHHLHYSSTPSENPTTLPLATLLPHVSAFRNRIPIARADTSFNLDGPEEKPDRTNLIYVSGMTKAVGQAELTPVLSKFCPVRFIWVNDTATFVQLEDATQVQPLLRHLREGGLDPVAMPGVTAVDFATYEAASAGNDDPHHSENKSTPKPAARKRASESTPAAAEATPTKQADATPRADAEMEDGEWQASGTKKAKRKRKVSAGKGGGREEI